MKIAKLQYNILVEIINDLELIPANSSEFQYVDITDINPEPVIGSQYFGDGVFKLTTKWLSKLEFRNRFTMEEKIAFDSFEVNPNLTDMQKNIVRTLTKDLEMTDYVDLTSSQTISGVYFIESVGIIGTGRASVVLS